MTRLQLALVVLVLMGTLAPVSAQSLLVCGWDEVFVPDISAASHKVWSWKAMARPELPAPYRSRFSTTDECKPVAGDRVLITASSDCAALVERSPGRTIWGAECGNAHSAELLPGDRIVLAGSVREDTGNRGHGAVWDASRPCCGPSARRSCARTG